MSVPDAEEYRRDHSRERRPDDSEVATSYDAVMARIPGVAAGEAAGGA